MRDRSYAGARLGTSEAAEAASAITAANRLADQFDGASELARGYLSRSTSSATELSEAVTAARGHLDRLAGEGTQGAAATSIRLARTLDNLVGGEAARARALASLTRTGEAAGATVAEIAQRRAAFSADWAGANPGFRAFFAAAEEGEELGSRVGVWEGMFLRNVPDIVRRHSGLLITVWSNPKAFYFIDNLTKDGVTSFSQSIDGWVTLFNVRSYLKEKDFIGAVRYMGGSFARPVRHVGANYIDDLEILELASIERFESLLSQIIESNSDITYIANQLGVSRDIVTVVKTSLVFGGASS